MKVFYRADLQYRTIFLIIYLSICLAMTKRGADIFHGYLWSEVLAYHNWLAVYLQFLMCWKNKEKIASAYLGKSKTSPLSVVLSCKDICLYCGSWEDKWNRSYLRADHLLVACRIFSFPISFSLSPSKSSWSHPFHSTYRIIPLSKT